MTTYTFTGPKVTAKRTGNCPTCGRKTTRSQTFEKTVNPFNRDPETGQPKTWDQVRADVKAEAEAWNPEPAVFEHDACLADRTAPPRAAPVGVDPERLADSELIRSAMSALGEFTESSRLPLTRAEFELDNNRTCVTATITFVPAGEIIAWARALDLTKAPVEDGGWCTYIRLCGDVDGTIVQVHAYVTKPSVGDRLGGAPVEWGRDRKGRRNGIGTVSVDALAAGLAVMGIAVVDPALTFSEQPDIRLCCPCGQQTVCTCGRSAGA